jgi:hypothetical protein
MPCPADVLQWWKSQGWEVLADPPAALVEAVEGKQNPAGAATEKVKGGAK